MRANKIPFRISPMLATLVSKPFSRLNWIFEEKYDGVRIIAYKENSDVSLVSRNGINRAARYPEIADAVRKLPVPMLALDGEIVVFDAKRISRFQLLQQSKGRPQYVLFDCLYAGGQDLRERPLSERREILERTVKPSGVLLLSNRLPDDGLKAFQIASNRGLEGIVAKNLASIYREGRSTDWLKVKVHQEDEFVIGGYTQPSGSRHHFGALLLGVYQGGRLQYVGKVGTGFNEAALASLYKKFQRHVREKSPFSTGVRERGATFLEPVLVAQISYGERTADGKLRQPVFLGLRDDKSAKEVVEQGA